MNNKNLFSEYLLKMDSKLWNYTPKLKNDTNYYAIIVEPREDFDMKIIMKTVMYFLNETKSDIKWGLQIFHGTKNEELIKKQTYNWGDITYTNLNVPNLTKQEYNNLLKNNEFWKKVKGDKVLIFQSDSILIKSGIDEFLKYDYVGAPWLKPKENSLVGNGGLSLRTVRKMEEICHKYGNSDEPLEDIFFMTHLKDNVADFETAKRFGVEDVPYPTPLGIHLSKKLDSTIFKQILGL
jgi:hypothetical protein